MADPALPEQAAIVRLVDPDMSHALSQWVILNVLDHLRDGRFYRENACHKLFESRDQRQTQNLPIAIYGMGAIGLVIARRLADLGFDVSGWSRTSRQFPALSKLHMARTALPHFWQLVIFMFVFCRLRPKPQIYLMPAPLRK